MEDKRKAAEEREAARVWARSQWETWRREGKAFDYDVDIMEVRGWGVWGAWWCQRRGVGCRCARLCVWSSRQTLYISHPSLTLFLLLPFLLLLLLLLLLIF